jgi:hypothetical protein
MSDFSRGKHYLYSDNPHSRHPQSFELVRAIKLALHNVSGFILLGVVLLVAFLIAMASASRVVQASSLSTASAQIFFSVQEPAPRARR